MVHMLKVKLVAVWHTSFRRQLRKPHVNREFTKERVHLIQLVGKGVGSRVCLQDLVTSHTINGDVTHHTTINAGQN